MYSAHLYSAHLYSAHLYSARLYSAHIYSANINCTQLCTFTALGLLISHTPITGARKNGRLLPKDTFKKTLRELLRRTLHETRTHDSDEEVVVVMSAVQERRIAFRKLLDESGIPFEEIGTHSYRKGSATYTASGSTDAPPIVAICLRAGWKLGGVLNTYLSLESAGDRFVGRVCALLPQVSKKFCVLPPRFPLSMHMSQGDRDLVDHVMKAMFGKYKHHGSSFACVLRHCLASLCFHREWLTKLPACHPWHATYLGLRPEITKKLKSLVGPLRFDGEDQYCHGTGIPSWTHLALRVERLEDVILELPSKIVGDTSKLLDEKGALARNITRSELKAAMEEVVRTSLAEYRRLGPPVAAEVVDLEIIEPQFFRWSDNTFHRLPEDFILTCIGTSEAGNIVRTPLQGYIRWNMADHSNKICAIRMCDPTDFAVKNQRKRFSDWRRLFTCWKELLKQHGIMPLTRDARRNATVDDWVQRFNLAFEIHCTLIKFFHPSKAKRKRTRQNVCAYLTLKISTTLHDYRAILKAIPKFQLKLRRYRGLVRLQRLCRLYFVTTDESSEE